MPEWGGLAYEAADWQQSAGITDAVTVGFPPCLLFPCMSQDLPLPLLPLSISNPAPAAPVHFQPCTCCTCAFLTLPLPCPCPIQMLEELLRLQGKRSGPVGNHEGLPDVDEVEPTGSGGDKHWDKRNGE